MYPIFEDCSSVCSDFLDESIVRAEPSVRQKDLRLKADKGTSKVWVWTDLSGREDGAKVYSMTLNVNSKTMNAHSMSLNVYSLSMI